MIFKSLKQNNSGLSLTEVLVVVSIMVTINTMIFLSNRSVNVGRSVEMSAFRMASEIRKMQSYTLNLQNYKNGVYPSGGWGIFIDTSHSDTVYSTFADGVSAARDHQFAANELSATNKLPTKVRIKNILYKEDVSDPGIEVSKLTLTFEPPDPNTWICDYANCNGVYVEIILEDDNGGNQHRIMVNKFGLIEVIK